jgi:hypothetical protein
MAAYIEKLLANNKTFVSENLAVDPEFLSNQKRASTHRYCGSGVPTVAYRLMP